MAAPTRAAHPSRRPVGHSTPSDDHRLRGTPCVPVIVALWFAGTLAGCGSDHGKPQTSLVAPASAAQFPPPPAAETMPDDCDHDDTEQNSQ